MTFPGVVLNGVMMTAANVHHSWIGVNAPKLFGGASVLNDADAAGMAEMTFGEGRGAEGTVLMLTFGTGIGSALFVDGDLVPNTELGHLQLHGKDAEHRASDRAREEHDLTLGEVGQAGGGVSAARGDAVLPVAVHHRRGRRARRPDKFLPHVHVDTPIIPAAPGATKRASSAPLSPSNDHLCGTVR